MWPDKAGLGADAPQPALPRVTQPKSREYPRHEALVALFRCAQRVYTAQAEGFARKPGARVAVELQKLDLWDHLKAAQSLEHWPARFTFLGPYCVLCCKIPELLRPLKCDAKACYEPAPPKPNRASKPETTPFFSSCAWGFPLEPGR